MTTTAPTLNERDIEALHRAERATREQGEPTEYDALFWRFVGPFIDGWSVALVWDHHDGEIVLAGSAGLTLAEAIDKTLAEWSDKA